jgi:uncharacterized iron-regulated protein
MTGPPCEAMAKVTDEMMAKAMAEVMAKATAKAMTEVVAKATAGQGYDCCNGQGNSQGNG